MLAMVAFSPSVISRIGPFSGLGSGWVIQNAKKCGHLTQMYVYSQRAEKGLGMDLCLVEV